MRLRLLAAVAVLAPPAIALAQQVATTPPIQTSSPPVTSGETSAVKNAPQGFSPGQPPDQPIADLAANAKQSPIPVGALEVTATGTLEWLRADQMYVARQNAVARHNDTTLKADILVAHYRIPPGKKSGSEIVQVTAEGNPVKVISPTAVAYGQHGVYDLPQHLVLLLGNNLRLITTDEIVTARDSLEYYEDLDIGVARGDAVMLRGTDKLTADVIAAKFVQQGHGNGATGGGASKKGSGKTAAKPPVATWSAMESSTATASAGDQPKAHSLERLDAKGHVVLVTETDVVTGAEAVYNPITDQTTVIGDVHVTRDQNQLDGSRAEVDMTTGISRVFAAPSAKVHGLFVPKKKDKDAGNDAGDADAIVGKAGGEPAEEGQ